MIKYYHNYEMIMPKKPTVNTIFLDGDRKNAFELIHMKQCHILSWKELLPVYAKESIMFAESTG